VFFFGFLWGIPGAFLGVPILIAILMLCAHYPSTRWIATLLSGTPKSREPDEEPK
jgi:predicted PurR-regulated permease PerM